MRQTHYGRLGVPSTATQIEIRAAYQRQIDRVRAGELPSSLEPEIERAYATLGNSSRRLSYDADFAAQSAMPITRLTSSPPATLVAGMAVGAALSVAVVLAMSPLGRVVWSPAAPPSRANASTIAAALPPAVTAPEATVAAPAVPTEAAAVPSDSPAAAPATDDQTAAPAASAAPAVPVAPPVSVARAPAAPRPAAPVVTYRQSPVYYYSGYESDSAYTASTEPDQTPAFADSQSAPAVEAPPVVVNSPRTAPSLLSAPFGGSRISLRFPGYYCSDASGGQIFVAAGAPLPQGVTC